MGEPAGIGGEIALKAWLQRNQGVPPFVIVDDPRRLSSIAKQLGWKVPIEPIGRAFEADAVFNHALPVLPLSASCEAPLGAPTIANADAVVESIDCALNLVSKGDASAIVTNPINKHVLMTAGFQYPGHTEYLAARGGRPGAGVMMLASATLRVVPVTVHIPLREVADALSVDAIVHCGRVVATALENDFGIRGPQLAIAGLNPHAGEDGALGKEDLDVVQPAVEQLRDAGIQTVGPSPADSLFHEAARRTYDAAICMYHDQALIPIKTIDFDGGVNVTLGLPFIRTSPDHGTAFDIAGTGRASPRSLIEALKLAASMAATRSNSLSSA